MVRGSELFAALAECGASGLGIGLEVDEGNGFVERQRSTTEWMILPARAPLEKIATQVRTEGLRTRMPMERDGEVRYYPFAVQADPYAPPILPAGTIVLTGTPEGVAMQAPSGLHLANRSRPIVASSDFPDIATKRPSGSTSRVAGAGTTRSISVAAWRRRLSPTKANCPP